MTKRVHLERESASSSVLELDDRIDDRIDDRTDDRTDEAALAQALIERVRGEVRFGAGDRALYASDAGNYRFPPIGVVVPRDSDDVVAALEVCRRFDVPVLSRGAGTSLAGQCCNHGVVIDFSKYVRGVLEIDPTRRLARVLPGTVLDDLNREAREHGLVFAPDPATHTHCTLGGMIGNDSCGVHSIQSEFYGPGVRTDDHVHALEVVTYDGVRMRVGATDEGEYERIQREGGRRAEIYAALRGLRDRYADVIRARFPNIPRRVSGYGLPALLPENGFHVARSLVGSESTCATVLEATLHLGRHFPARALLLLGYEDLAAAGDDVPRIRALPRKPIGLEGLDSLLTRFVRRKRLHPEYLRALPEGDGWLLVELGGDTAEEAETYAREAERALTSRLRRWPRAVVLTDPEEQAKIWQIRESGLGATAFVPGMPDSWPGWEDSAVHPDVVGPYLRELRALLDRYGYQAALYGHLGQGCIHTRIPFDLRSEAGIESYRRFTKEAAELVVRFGGSLSGEHGDGQARADLLPMMFGPELVQAFRELKAIWDPDGRMNPGKVVDPLSRTENLRLGEGYPAWEPKTRLALTDDQGSFSHAALRCVGVGKCRRESGGVMCPSYMVTREEKHSTRGRARMLFELVRGETLPERWASEEVVDALDLCLSCKGCKSDCPVNVDMALYKSEVMYHHYQGKRRPRHAYAFGLIERWARLGSAIPGLSNLGSHAPGLRALAKKAAGMAPEREVPTFAAVTFRQWFERRARPRPSRRDGARRRVLLWPDTFNDHFTPNVLAAAVEVLEHAGVEVDIPRARLCCGRPLYDYGMLDRAERQWREILAALRTEIIAGTVVVGVEPSCVAAFRDELVQLLPDERLARELSSRTQTLAEYLDGLPDYAPPRLEGRAALFHPHCHHHAVMGVSPDRRLLERMGLDVEAPATGCCGMAGAFGFEEEHYEVSVACAERVLLPKVRQQPDDGVIIADGFSCREQIRQLSDRRALHLAEVMQLARYREERTGAADEPRRPEAEVARELRPDELQPASLSTTRATFGLVGAIALGAAAWYWLVPLWVP